VSESTTQQLLDDADRNPFAGAALDADHTYEGAWRMPADIDRLLRETTADGYTLNVCAGKLDVGDVLVDADPQLPHAIPADMDNLPFEDATFDYVILDPPWKLNYYKRQTPFFEAVRVTKPDGLILANWLWIGESQNTRIDGPMFIRADDPWANISVIVPHRKQPAQADLTMWGVGNDAVPTRPNPLQMTTCANCGEQIPEMDAYESETLFPGTFCSADHMHEVEHHFGEPLTPVDEPTQYYRPGPAGGEGQ
jgi:hypothetical protein